MLLLLASLIPKLDFSISENQKNLRLQWKLRCFQFLNIALSTRHLKMILRVSPISTVSHIVL